jgi:hypothetical protein
MGTSLDGWIIGRSVRTGEALRRGRGQVYRNVKTRGSKSHVLRGNLLSFLQVFNEKLL